MTRDSLIVGNCSGFFGDRQSAASEVVRHPGLDVLTGDWLAELTMLILQKQHARDPLRGFASTFVAQVEEVLGTCLDRGIKIVSNAGGVNPGGCAEAVRSVAERLGLQVSVGTVSGDDVSRSVIGLAAAGQLTDMSGGMLDLNRKVLAANAYLGGWGITACLAGGADIVVTGRVTDAALVTGPAAWAFGWTPTSWNELAGAVVAGHVIECGAQATGGNYPFFTELGSAPRIGFPIAELRADGSSIITKVDSSDGAVTVDTVKAQLLYEVQSETYHNADVSLLLESVRVEQVGQDRVLVSGALGVRPPDQLKVSMGVEGGWRNSMTLVLTGREIEQKAQMAEAAVWDAIPCGREAFDDVDVELLGRPVEDPATMGESVSLLRIAVSSTDERLAGRQFSSAVVQTGLASYPGFYMTAPPGPASSYARYVPALVDADQVVPVAAVDGFAVDVAATPRGPAYSRSVADRTVPATSRDWTGAHRRVALGELCGARSGDKGGNANVGIWVRDERAWPWLRDVLDASLFASLLPGKQTFEVQRFELPHLHALNFVVLGWLGDGVASNLRLDAQAKGLAEYVRSRWVDIPEELLDIQKHR